MSHSLKSTDFNEASITPVPQGEDWYAKRRHKVVCSVLGKNPFTVGNFPASSRQKDFAQRTCWARDLCAEGIEPNPGPIQRKSRKHGRPGFSNQGPLALDNGKFPLSRALIARDFHRKIDYSSFSANSAVGYGGAISFRFSDLPNYSEISSLFDHVRLIKVKFDFIPGADTSFVNPANDNVPNSLLWVAPDYDNDSTPTVGDILQKEGARYVRSIDRLTMTIAPRIKEYATDGVSANAAAVAAPGSWIDAAASGVRHYGIKFFLEASQPLVTTALVRYRIIADVHFQARAVQ
jgi:hypothetical protein